MPPQSARVDSGDDPRMMGRIASQRIRRSWFPVVAAVALLAAGLNPSPAWAAGNAGLKLSKTISGTSITPIVSFTFSVDKASAIPGDTLTYSGIVSNPSADFGVSGKFFAESHANSDAVVASYFDQVETCSSGCGNGKGNPHWIPIAGFGATTAGYTPQETATVTTGMILSAKPVTSTGVIYPTTGDEILGTDIAAGSTGIWDYSETISLTPPLVAMLSDPNQVQSIRNEVHMEVTPRNSNAAEPWTDDEVFTDPFQTRSNPGNAVNITIAVTFPDGTSSQITSSTVPGFASIAPGASVHYSTIFKIAAPAAKGTTETDAAYIARLTALEGTSLKASATLTAGGFSGVVTLPAQTAATVEHLPIVSVVKGGPSSANAGTTATYSIALFNSGGAIAGPLNVTDSLPNGTAVSVTGVPSNLASPGSATASASYAIPSSQPCGPLTDTARVTWLDANSNVYGPISSSYTLQVTNCLSGATLTLSPALAGPNVTGTSQTLTATLIAGNGNPISGLSVAFVVTGANPSSGNGTTDQSGSATFTYTGKNNGNDTVQATVTSGTFTLQSNTATIGWVTPVASVSTSSVTGRFYYGGCGSFCADVTKPPVFTQSFPTIDFNPPGGTIPGNITGVGVSTRPFTDITTNPIGDFTGAVVAQGNGHQAGAGDLFTFDAVFTGNYLVAAAGDITFNFYSDDGFILGVGGGATRVGGSLVNPPAGSELQGYPVMGAYNVPTSPVANQITVHFPSPGSYPYEVDYSECCGGEIALTMANAATGVGVPPAGNLSLTPVNVPTQIVGQPVRLTVAAMDASGHPIASLPLVVNVGGTNTLQVASTTDGNGLAVISYIGASPGTDSLIANATVSGMPAVSNVVNITWAFGGGSSQAQPPPVITAPSPADGSLVTKPIPVNATFTPPAGQTIASWSVTYQSVASGAVVALASGSGTPPVTLATFDPTLLPNDTYTITISATASGGGTQTLSSTVAVFGNLKLGRYVTTYQDLSVPVNGVPMEVRRSYDSTDKRVGDFGIGWHVSVANFRVSTNRQLGGGGWTEYTTSCFILCNWAYKTSTPHYVTVTFPDGHEEVFDFTPTGPQLAFIDFAFGTAAFTARAGTGTTSTLAVANASDQGFTYAFDGNLYASSGSVYSPTRFQLTTHDGRVLILDTALGLVSETDRNGNSLAVDGPGIHASNGQSITYSRDAQGRIVQITGPSGQILGYAYSSAGDLASSTDANGNTTTYSYDNNHNMLHAIGPAGQALQTLQYDASGRLSAITDAVGNTTQIANNISGQQQTIVDPNGHLTTVDSLDDLGDLLREDKVFNGQTLTNTFTYDAVGHVLTHTDAVGQTTNATYDAAGDVLTFVDSAGGTTKFAYNSLGEPTSVTDPAGGVTSSAYDAIGNLLHVTQPDGSTFSFQHDSAGHTTVATDPLNNTTSYTYDAAGHVVSETNGLGQKTNWIVDASGKVSSVTDPAGSTTSFRYDATGNLTQVTDALGHSTAFTYDAFEQVLSSTDPLGRATRYQYDPAERPVQVTNPDGQVVTFSYDADGRIVSQTLPGSDASTYVYDPLGRLTTASNSDEMVTFTYDAGGRVVSTTTAATTTSNQPHVTLTYAYDSRGNRTSLADPAGIVTYAYDAMSRATQITDPTGGKFSLSYDSLSRLTSLGRPNGVTDALTYNAAGDLMSRVSTQGGSTLATYTYTVDAARLRASLTDLTGSSSYTYDAASRLVAATHPPAGPANETYSFDAAGNRLSSAFQPAGTLTYDAADELLGDPTSTYTYDGEGDRTSKTDRTTGAVTRYVWNARHQLKAINLADGTSTTFRYDALGRRIEVSHGGSVTRYVYDQVSARLEYDGSNTLTASYVSNTGVDSTLEMTRGTNRYFYLRDGLGSTTRLTDSTGAVVQTYTYDSYGRQTASGNIANPFTFTGREYDSGSGLYYYRSRYYDPSTGSFLSEDPFRGINPFVYANDDPTNMIDPFGAQALLEFTVAIKLTTTYLSALLPYAKLNACLWGVLLIALQDMTRPRFLEANYEQRLIINLAIKTVLQAVQVLFYERPLATVAGWVGPVIGAYSAIQYAEEVHTIANGAPCEQNKALADLCGFKLVQTPPGP